MDNVKSFTVGFIVGIAILVVLLSFLQKSTIFYLNGKRDCMKEGYAHGFVEKVITPDDKVVYLWKTNK